LTGSVVRDKSSEHCNTRMSWSSRQGPNEDTKWLCMLVRDHWISPTSHSPPGLLGEMPSISSSQLLKYTSTTTTPPIYAGSNTRRLIIYVPNLVCRLQEVPIQTPNQASWDFVSGKIFQYLTRSAGICMYVCGCARSHTDIHRVKRTRTGCRDLNHIDVLEPLLWGT